MRVGPLYSNFNAGEFGARMAARSDFAKYANAGARFENLLPLPQGGFTRRPGSRYVVEVKDSSVRSRVKSFEYSTIQAYVLELADNAVRFHRNQGQITVAETDAVINNGTFAAGITGWTDSSTGGASIAHDATNGRMNLVGAASQTSIATQQVSIGASYRSTVHVLRFQVYGAPGDEIKLRIGTTSGATDILDDFVAGTGMHAVDFDPDGNASVYIQFRNADAKTKQVDNISLLSDEALEIGSPWGEDDLQGLKFAQSADVMYCVAGGTIPIYRLERYGHQRWSLEEVLLTDGPYLDENTTSTTLTPGAASGFGITVTASAVTGINDGQGFLTTDVGRNIRIKNGANWAWGVIVGHTSATVVTVDRKGATAFTTSAVTTWNLGEFSGTTGYPSVVSFVQQRLGFAATTLEPQKFYLSQSAGIEDFTPDDLTGTVEADDAITYRLAAEDVNTIVWMSYRRKLALGTIGGEWSVESQDAILTPTDISAIPQTTFGSSETVPAIKARNRQLFIQRTGRKLLEFGYNFSDDAYASLDLTVLNDRVLQTGVRELAYGAEPDSVLWCLREDGVLAALTYLPDQEVIGWSRHIVGGSLGSGDAVVESICSIPGTNGAGQVKDSTGRTEVWMIVKRTINGVTKRYIEVFEKLYNGAEDAQEDAYYSDSLVTYDSTSTSTITGLNHLEGETVKVWADGALQTDKTVASGSITLDRAASVVQVGLPYTHKWKSLQLAFGARAGTAQGKSKIPQYMAFNLLETAENSIQFGAIEGSLDTLELRDAGDATTLPAPLYTGITEPRSVDAQWRTDARMFVEGEMGPCTVLAIPFDLDIHERM